ncbi:MAG: hypothetical protein LUH57_04240 [Ruminococcus sp.]|nr:hypothetical protein [Ruminococcus sp.]
MIHKSGNLPYTSTSFLSVQNLFGQMEQGLDAENQAICGGLICVAFLIYLTGEYDFAK